MIVSPAARGKAFKLKVRVSVCIFAVAHGKVACVMENGQAGAVFIDSFAYTARIIHIRIVCEAICVVIVEGVHTLCLHIPHALAAVARNNVQYIKEDSVRIVVLANLCDLIEKEIKVTGVKAESVVAGSCEVCRPRDALILIAKEPFGLFARRSFVKACGKVNGCLNAYFVRRFYLLAQKVEAKTGMHLVCFGGVICPTVVAFGEKRYRIHMAHFKASLELLAGKFSAYVFYILTRMKIEMYLSESHLNTSQIN
jgi:hypothetical protein